MTVWRSNSANILDCENLYMCRIGNPPIKDTQIYTDTPMNLDEENNWKGNRTFCVFFLSGMTSQIIRAGTS